MGDMEGEVEKEAMEREVEKEAKFPNFDEKMVVPQIFSLQKDWESFKKFFENDKKALMEPFDLTGNTAIHVATRSNNPQLVIDLLEMLPEPADRRRALRKENAHRNTLLHHIIHCSNVKMVDVLLEYDRRLKVPEEEEEEEEREAAKKKLPLLELGNDLGETPVYRAAKYGKLKILKQMAKFVDMRNHFYRTADRTSILHIAIIGQYFGVVLWLSRVKSIDEIALQPDGNGLTCLQLLSRMPSVFRSHSQMEFLEKLIYSYLPEKECHKYSSNDDEEDDNRQRGDIESGKEDERQPISEWDEIENIWKKKRQHKLVEEVAEFLVEKDKSWQKTFHAKPRTEVVLPVIQPCCKGKKKVKLEKIQSIEQPIRSSVYTPLLLAASTGIVEIVKRIIEKHPEAIGHVSDDEQNILHVVVKHRQKSILKLLKKYGALKRLASQMGNKGRTLLHQVSRMDYYDGGKQAGVVFQLQDELRWFERVKKIIPNPFILYCNDDNLTARELFELEHADMLKEAQEWIKGTAQSCSAVAVLVATVVFAAAYTIPGGTDDNGIPIFLNSPLFLFFTIADVVALASSLVSVMMFLSVLTSPFQMQEFYKSLPRKLTLGFALLFFSLTTTMLVFGSTILLTIRLESKKWSSSLIYSVTFFPVTLFGLMQFPIIMAVKYRTKRLWKTFKNLLPKGFTRSTKRIKKKVYSKYS